jgi:hypothetical protein
LAPSGGRAGCAGVTEVSVYPPGVLSFHEFDELEDFHPSLERLLRHGDCHEKASIARLIVIVLEA